MPANENFEDNELEGFIWQAANETPQNWDEWKIRYRRVMWASKIRPGIVKKPWTFNGVEFDPLTFGDIP